MEVANWFSSTHPKSIQTKYPYLVRTADVNIIASTKGDEFGTNTVSGVAMMVAKNVAAETRFR